MLIRRLFYDDACCGFQYGQGRAGYQQTYGEIHCVGTSRASENNHNGKYKINNRAAKLLITHLLGSFTRKGCVPDNACRTFCGCEPLAGGVGGRAGRYFAGHGFGQSWPDFPSRISGDASMFQLSVTAKFLGEFFVGGLHCGDLESTAAH